MTEPVSPADAAASRSSLLTTAIWVVIGALIAAALVCVVWVLFGSQNGLVGRAFLTILLLIGFAAVAIMDVRLAARRAVWFALTSMAVWIVTLLIGAFMIWMPGSDLSLAGRVVSFLVEACEGIEGVARGLHRGRVIVVVRFARRVAGFKKG